MHIAQQRMTCFKCGHVFEAEIVLNAPMDVAIASMRAVSCPRCGEREIGLGGAYKDAPPLTASVAVRANWWWMKGFRGTSSETIFAAMTGGGTFKYDYPYDPDDYSRCKRLLDLIPEWRADLGKVTERFPWFAPFEAAWDRFDELWEEEHRTGTAPKLYAEIQKAIEDADRIRVEVER